MSDTIANDLIPSLIPHPKKEDRDNMVLYYTYYEKYKDRLQKELVDELALHPFWSQIMKTISPEQQEERNKLSQELQKKAIYQNDWEPYVTDLVHQGIMYATMGVSFGLWFELVNMYRKYVTVLLVSDNEPKSIQIIEGMNNFMDIALSIIGEAYVAEKKSIVEHQKKEQENLNKELEQFLYIATHDLQEPLRNITSYVQLMQKKYAGKLDENGNGYLAYIDTSTNLMRELVKGLMDYSIIGNEKIAEKTDCNELIQKVVDNMQAAIEEKEASIIINQLPTINIYPREMSLLFQNLISNALKFSRDQVPPEITISSKKGKHAWEFSVSDNGLGIDPKYFEKIFVIFQRLHPRTKFEGTGIGLAHCKKIVELHHGKIWVESKINEGTTFYFTIHEK